MERRGNRVMSGRKAIRTKVMAKGKVVNWWAGSVLESKSMRA